MFLIRNTDFQEVFTPEDFTNQHKDIASAVEEFVKGEIASRGEEIEVLNKNGKLVAKVIATFSIESESAD